MKCRACGLEHSPLIRCERNQAVTKSMVTSVVTTLPEVVTQVVTCQECVKKDLEIARLVEELGKFRKPEPKRNRAEYMKAYRRKANGA